MGTATLIPQVSNTREVPGHRAPLVLGPSDYERISVEVGSLALRRRAIPAWYACFAVGVSLLLLLLVMISYQIGTGVGVWGNNIPVAWGYAITNFVWWIGIGHAGTLISAILYLLRQKWRNSINRLAEAMTLCAVACAGIFPLIHVGRAWFAYWLVPYPNQMGVWPNFFSPLVWDMVAVSTYGTVSLLFWYLGMLPDLATMRVLAATRGKRRFYGILSLGWRGSARHWEVYEISYLLLAGLATPLVFSVHSVVSFDFAVAQLKGWHSTIFPPYFVAGAIYSGFAMVISLVVPARKLFRLQNVITPRHMENMCKVLLLTCWMVGYSYITEIFLSWFSGNLMDRFSEMNRFFGPYRWYAATMLLCNMVAPQLFWFKKVRQSMPAMFVISILVNIGMWLERYVIIVVSLHRDFMPSSWGVFHGTWVDNLTLLGSFGLFLTMFLLFCRYLPMVSMSEVKLLMPADKEMPRARRLPELEPGFGKVFGLAARFNDKQSLVAAARAVRAAGYKKWDCLTPFPVRHLGEAMGIRRSILPWLVFLGGLLGTSTALFFQYWVHAVNYPLAISGKPYWSLPTHVPVGFEFTILLASFTSFFGLFALIRLPKPHHPVMNNVVLRRGVVDGFFLIIEAADPRYQRETTAQLLENLGGIWLEEVEA